MSKGSLVLIPFPFTDLSGQKVRPALVLYHQKGGEDCIVSFISSVPQKRLGIHEISIVPTKDNGLKSSSVIKVNKIATLQKEKAAHLLYFIIKDHPFSDGNKIYLYKKSPQL